MSSPADILGRYWGYTSFRPRQLEIIESVMSGRDTIGLLPTGGGKSITFQVPALLMPGVTLVVTPLISLMKDQVDNLRRRGIMAVCIHSGLSRPEQQLAFDRARLGKTNLVYVSPERLQRSSFIGELRQWQLSMIVVDEAHCISQWGYDFRPNYLKIADLRKEFPDAVMLALTASATPEVVRDISEKLQMRSPALFSLSFSRNNISYLVRRGEHKEETMLKILNNTQGSAIVYVRSRKRTRELAGVLQAAGISADYYHAGLLPEDKNARQNDWKSGATRVIVATNAFGMGIDKPDVRTVIHYDLPPSLEEYYQEAGRAGRDGKDSYAVLLVSGADKALLGRRLADAFPPKEDIVKIYDRIGVWLGVAVDGGFQQVYDFNIEKFCALNHFQPARVRSALGILTLAGYLEYVDDNASMARVMILADKCEFYSLELDSDTDAVFQCLLRSYPGLFADYVNISEERMARDCGLGTERVYESLLTLSRMHVLHYVPRRLEPYICYTQRRQLPRYISLPLAVYEHRLERARARMESIKAFAFGDGGCRVRDMLRYFGESDAAECGRCDYCRDEYRRRHSPEPLDEEAVLADVRAVVAACGQGVSLTAFAERYRSRSDEAVELLRRLADRGCVELRAMRIYINEI